MRAKVQTQRGMRRSEIERELSVREKEEEEKNRKKKKKPPNRRRFGGRQGCATGKGDGGSGFIYMKISYIILRH